MTFLEITLVVFILGILVSAVAVMFSKTLRGRSVDGEIEKLAGIIRSAQSRAADTETVQAIFLSEDKLLWVAYQGKTIEEVETNCNPDIGEQVRNYKFKDNVEITELWIESMEITPIPNEPQNNIAILIDEKGEMSKANITMAKEKITNWLSLNNREAKVGKTETNELALIWLSDSLQPPPTYTDDETIICKSEELLVRGWQTINVENVDKVKEVKFRVKTDIRLPSSAHLHVYVFPCREESKNVVHGVVASNDIEERGSSFSELNIPFTILPCSWSEFQDYYTISGHVLDQNGQPIENVMIYISNAWPSTYYTNRNGEYVSVPLVAGTAHNVSAGKPGYDFEPNIVIISNLNANTTVNFTGYLMYDINGYIRDEQGMPMEGVAISCPGYSSPLSLPDGSYMISGLREGYDYTITPSKVGYRFDPLQRVYNNLNGNQTNQNFTAIPIGITPYAFSMGNWNKTEAELLNAAMPVPLEIFGNINELKGYYVYQNEIQTISSCLKSYEPSEQLIMYTLALLNFNSYPYIGFFGSSVNLNALNPGSKSDFPKEGAQFDGNYWHNGFIQSKLAGQTLHSSSSSVTNEIQAGKYAQWLNIPISSGVTKLRIVVSAYHKNEESKEQLFNCFPTSSSTHSNEMLVNADFDYPNDPFIVYYPWYLWKNDPFWLSHYAYMLRPLTRPPGTSVLATKGPATGDNYNNFWYGPLYLDWDKLLGEENILWLLGWFTGTFGICDSQWQFQQQGDTYNYTASAPPSHYWLKNFSMLSYWLNFQYSSYFFPQSALPKRIQEPINLLRDTTGFGILLYEEYKNINVAPYESSSLSVPFLSTPSYPTWLATLPGVFSQQKIATSPDLYSSFYYLQERINHTMLDVAVWVGLNSTNQQEVSTVFYNIISAGNLGNFEQWSSPCGETLAAWWRWYQNIPWAKGQAFPQKTGPNPTNYKERIGWERPVLTAPPNYYDYFNGVGYYTDTNSYNYRLISAPHSIYMSTAHYPLGTIQIKVKKK